MNGLIRFKFVSCLRPLVLWAALSTSVMGANSHLVHNLISDLPGVADQQDDELINPWDFIAFDVCTPVGSPSCTPPDVSSVLIAANGYSTVTQYTPIPGVVEPESYPSLLPGVTGIMGTVRASAAGHARLGLRRADVHPGRNDPGIGGLLSNVRYHTGR